ncbi:hypothetical protein O181_025021 [Austropuccinia psidii MF-1]|uniref:Uncharacterized protein n=1 Tax=Austropuccinia psidii MF-1 TaxID=1389203 RepID=A0A9Q3GZ59_9BASI|nr:hypothetical protein [Austropuccinia psidii MF-1]
MQIARISWVSTRSSEIKNCGRHTYIITNGPKATEITMPSSLTNDITQYEQAVEEESNFFVKTGVFHGKNMMSFDELLDPHHEGNLEKWSPEESFSTTLAEDSSAHNRNSQGKGDGQRKLICEKKSEETAQKAKCLLMKFISDEKSQEADCPHHSPESYSPELDYSLLENSQQKSIQDFFDPAILSLM